MTLNTAEALRYLGIPADADAALRAQMDALADQVTRRFPPKWTWRCFGLSHGPDGLSAGGIPLPGRTAETMLHDCAHVCVLVCTLGMHFEASTRIEQARDMRRAVMLDALGSAWVEAGCDAAQAEIVARFPGMHLTDRFSPGYGDLPLTIQPLLLAQTDATRRLGVYETDSHLLTPQKSVTALIGLSDRPQKARIRGCAFCTLRDTCTQRKVGMHCDI